MDLKFINQRNIRIWFSVSFIWGDICERCTWQECVFLPNTQNKVEGPLAKASHLQKVLEPSGDPASDSESDLWGHPHEDADQGKTKMVRRCLRGKELPGHWAQEQSILTQANTTELKTAQESVCSSHQVFNSCSFHFLLLSSIHRNNNKFNICSVSAVW